MNKGFVASIALLAFLTVGCSEKSAPKAAAPAGVDAKTVLNKSADAMESVSSVAFDITIDGQLTGFQIRKTKGTVTSDRRVQAVAGIMQGSSLIDYDFIEVEGIAYLKAGPTADFLLLNEQMRAALFDPAGLLTGEKSLPVGLAKAKTAKIVGEEVVAGVDCYIVKLMVPQDVVDGLAFLATGKVQEATAWIAKDTGYLLKGTLPFKISDSKSSTINATFFDFNKVVEITAPSI